MSSRGRWLILALIAHLLLALAFSLIVPLGEAPDEADHWAYVAFLNRERRLPRGPELTQAKHPPLYHATAALVAAVFVPNFGDLDTRLFLRANPDVTFDLKAAKTGAFWLNSFIHTRYEDWPWRPGPLAFHLARIWSVILSTLTVWATFLVLDALFPARQAVVWAGTFTVALLPEFAFIGGVVNNDPAAACLGTLAMAGAARAYAQRRLKAGWWTPLALGLGVWAKVSTSALAAGVILLVWWGLRGKHREDTRHLAKDVLRLGLFFLPGGLIVLPLGWRNWQLYGDPLGLELVRQTVDLRTGPWTWQDTWWLIRGWFVSFWGSFGSAGHIPLPSSIYAALAALTLLAAVGVLRAWREAPTQERRALVALGLAAVGVAAAIWRYSLIALGTNQGRLLFPAIAPLVGLWSYGLLAGWKAIPQARGAVGVIALLAGLVLYSLLGVVRPVYAAPPPAPTAEWSDYALPTAVRFDEIELIAANLSQEPVLYWRAARPPEHDWRVVLRITAVDGTLIWEWKRSPGAGRWSTDRWSAGYVMRDVYRVRWPDWAGPGRYRVEVGAYRFMGPWAIPYRGNEALATSDHPLYMVGWIERTTDANRGQP